MKLTPTTVMAITGLNALLLVVVVLITAAGDPESPTLALAGRTAMIGLELGAFLAMLALLRALFIYYRFKRDEAAQGTEG